MLSDFAVIIPSFGRSDRVFTHKTLRARGYTGRIIILCSDDDNEIGEYKKIYGDDVFVFNKDDYQGKFDKMDNFGSKACVVYARNAMWDIAKAANLKRFAVADDDYTDIQYRVQPDGSYYAKKARNCDDLFSAYIMALKETGLDTICFAQGGDYIGGGANTAVAGGFRPSRKMMNFYFFDVDKPIEFKGTINEDLTSSVTYGMTGGKIVTCLMSSVTQRETQSNAGGLTDIYLEVGTYVKSFYSVMAAPSCVKVAAMGDSSLRLHHEVKWKNAVPKIIRQELKK